MKANLGVGLPVLVADFIPKDVEVFLQAENGLLGLVIKFNSLILSSYVVSFFIFIRKVTLNYQILS